MPKRKAAEPTAARTDAWRGRIIDTQRKENHLSLAVDLDSAGIAALGLGHGDRLQARAGGHVHEVFFHGWMKAWSMYRRYFGEAAAAELANDPGVEAYRETDRTMGGISVPGHAEWLRLRLVLGHDGPEPALFEVKAGGELELTVVRRAQSPLPVASARVKQSAVQATVLASHPGALTLNVAFPALRKVPPQGDWHTLELEGREFRIRPRRGILPAQYEEIYAQPEALLFDFEPHWADEDTTVMVLRPMQVNWPGKFPDFASATIPVVAAVGAPAVIR